MTKSTDIWILLLDDDLEFTKLLEKFLSKMGIRMVAANRVEDFVEILKKELPTVCLVDLNINGLVAGFSIVKAMRKKYGIQLPLMMISGTNDQKAISQAIESGADDYIVKPIDLQVLSGKLGRFINIHKTKNLEDSYADAPLGGIEASIAFDSNVQALDEFGIKVLSSHFVTKGAPALLSGAFLQSIFPRKEHVLASVTGSQLLPDNSYSIMLEFAELSQEEQASLRKFLAEKRSR